MKQIKENSSINQKQKQNQFNILTQIWQVPEYLQYIQFLNDS